MKFEFCRQIFEKDTNIKFHETYPVGAELFHADGSTGMTKQIVAFRNFPKGPKNNKPSVDDTQQGSSHLCLFTKTNRLTLCKAINRLSRQPYRNQLQLINNKMQLFFYLPLISSTCSGRCFRPSSGAYHCNHSFWYCSPVLLLAGGSSTQYHQPAAPK